jgi:hypothetical protein
MKMLIVTGSVIQEEKWLTYTSGMIGNACPYKCTLTPAYFRILCSSSAYLSCLALFPSPIPQNVAASKQI